MSAFDHFQTATTFIAEGRRHEARREILAALEWIDRTGRDRDLRESLASLLAALVLWQNADGTWSHHLDTVRRWPTMEEAATDLRFHTEWRREQ